MTKDIKDIEVTFTEVTPEEHDFTHSPYDYLKTAFNGQTEEKA